MPSLIGRCGGGGSKIYEATVRGELIGYVDPSTPAVNWWQEYRTNQPSDIAFAGINSTPTTQALLELIGVGYTYDLYFSMQWEPFNGVRTVTFDLVDSAGTTKGLFGWEATPVIHEDGAPFGAIMTYTATGFELLDDGEPVWVKVTLDQGSPVRRFYGGGGVGLATTTLLVRAFQLS